MEAQDGEETEDDERGRSGGEAGVPVGFNFSIMVVVEPLGESLPSSWSSQLSSVSVFVCVCACVRSIYMYVRVTSMFLCTT